MGGLGYAPRAYGGYRNPSSAEGFERKVDEVGNILGGEQLHMRGMDVFNLVLGLFLGHKGDIENLGYEGRRYGYDPLPSSQPFHDGFLRQRIEVPVG